MKRIAAIFWTLLFFSCAQRDYSISVLNDDNLASITVTINPAKDTVLRLPKGGIISIPKGSFDKELTLEIREAYTLQDMLLAGLVTESNGQLLESGGMIYINTADKEPAAINKPISISIPTPSILAQMQLFKGARKDGIMNWTEAGTVQPMADTSAVTIGRTLFRHSCSPCHAIHKDLTGPRLAGLTQRGPWAEDRKNLVKWLHNPGAFIPTTAYTRNLQKTYVSIMPGFPALSDTAIDNLLAFIESEERKPMSDSSRYDLQPPPVFERADSLAYTTDINTYSADSLHSIEPDDPKFWEGSLRNGFTDSWYRFQIQTFGWYNVDAYVKGLPRTVLCDLTVSLDNFKETVPMTVYLLVPARRNLSVGVQHEGGQYHFKKDGGRIPLHLDDKAMIVAFGGSGNQVYYGLASFRVVKSQRVKVNINPPVSEQTFVQLMKQKNLEGLEITTAENSTN